MRALGEYLISPSSSHLTTLYLDVRTTHPHPPPPHTSNNNNE